MIGNKRVDTVILKKRAVESAVWKTHLQRVYGSVVRKDKE